MTPASAMEWQLLCMVADRGAKYSLTLHWSFTLVFAAAVAALEFFSLGFVPLPINPKARSPKRSVSAVVCNARAEWLRRPVWA